MPVDGAVVRCPARIADLADATHAGVLWRGRRGRLLLDIPEVARYLVSDGQLIEVEPVPGADAAEVRRFLRMTPAAALYLQRGIPVLHASVALTPGGCAVVLAGDSGAGKSVLLSALLHRGWRLLADDLAPVTLDEDRVPVALPTWPRIRQWPGRAPLTTAARRDGAWMPPSYGRRGRSARSGGLASMASTRSRATPWRGSGASRHSGRWPTTGLSPAHCWTAPDT